MSYISVKLDPGLDVEETATYNAAGYAEMDYGRFRRGLFEKLGGWTKYSPISVSGTGKALWAWQDLNGAQHLAAATTTEVDVFTSGSIQAITPQELRTNPTPNFSITIGDATVTVNDPGVTNVTANDSVEFLTPIALGDRILSGTYRITTRTGAHTYTFEARENALATEAAGGAVPVFTTIANSATVSVALDAHGQSVGNQVVFPLATTVGGVVVQGLYTVLSITSAGIFTIAVTTAATSGATVSMNTGLAALRYSITGTPPGGGLGYGLGDYGEGAYGLGGGGSGDQVGTGVVATDYSLDNWGELLIINPENRGIYYWGANGGFSNATLITEGPQYNTGAFISMGQQQIIAYGSSIKAYESGGIGEYQDPLWFQWCDLSNFFDWTPTAVNQAGGLRLPSGSKIVGGANTKNRNLLWSDLELWSLTYVNQPLVYTPNKVGDKCGLVGKHAWTAYSDAVYWMGNNNFFVYSGAGVLPIPCTVWDDVFQDLDRANISKVVCGSNSDFTEIWWFFPSLSGGTGAPDKAVKYNIIEGTWDTMPFGRLAWIDRSILGNPIAIAATGGIIYSHESGKNADDAAMMPRFLTGNFALDENETFIHVDEFVPDFKWGLEDGSENAQISITLWTRETPGADPVANGPYLVTKDTSYVTMDPPLRAKLVQVEVSSTDVDSFWRLGLLRFRQAPAGRQGFGA